MKLLIVEDDQSIQTLLKYNLESEGYDVECVVDGQVALNLIETNYYDLVIIDWMLPSLFGTKIVEQAKLIKPQLPILMLSAKDDENDVAYALNIGCDDYMRKPFSIVELNARVKLLLRRFYSETDFFEIKDVLKIDFNKLECYVNDKLVKLTKLEFEILKYLVNNKDIVLTRQDITYAIWKYDYENDSRILDVHMHSLKKKLSIKNLIESKRGVGYIFNSNI